MTTSERRIATILQLLIFLSVLLAPPPPPPRFRHQPADLLRVCLRLHRACHDMIDNALAALLQQSTVWPASGSSASFAAVAESLHQDQLQRLDDCLAKLSAAQQCETGRHLDSTAFPAPELLPVTSDLSFALACGLRLSRVTQRAARAVSDGLPSGASATGSTAAGRVVALPVRPAGCKPSAANSFQPAASAAKEGEVAGATSANIPPLPTALDACSWTDRTSAQSAQPSINPVRVVANSDCRSNSRQQPCQYAGSAVQAAESTCAKAPHDAAMAQSWRDPCREGQRSATLGRIADRSGKLEAAWLWRFMQPTALQTALGINDSSEYSCQSVADDSEASPQLLWHQKAAAALQLLEVLLDSCVLHDEVQRRHVAAVTGGQAPPVLHLLQLHLRVRDILSQHSGKAMPLIRGRSSCGS